MTLKFESISTVFTKKTEPLQISMIIVKMSSDLKRSVLFQKRITDYTDKSV